MGKETKVVKDRKSETAQIISNAVFSYLKEYKGLQFPTYQDIADRTGLSLKTIARHYKDLKFNPMDIPQRALTPLVINNLYAQTGRSTQAVKLWMQLVEGWSENADNNTTDNTFKITHNIVMNNNQDNKELDFTIDVNPT